MRLQKRVQPLTDFRRRKLFGSERPQMAACARLQPSLLPRFLDVATARHKVERFDDVGRIEQPTAPSLAATLRQVGGRGVGYSQAQAAVLAADKPTTKRPYPFYIRTTAVFFWFGDRKKKKKYPQQLRHPKKSRTYIQQRSSAPLNRAQRAHIYCSEKHGCSGGERGSTKTGRRSDSCDSACRGTNKTIPVRVRVCLARAERLPYW